MSKRTTSRKSKPKSKGKPAQRAGDGWQKVLAANAETIALIALVVVGLLFVDFVRRGEDATAGPVRQLFGWASLPILIAMTLVVLGILARQASGRLGLGLDIPWRMVGEVVLGGGLVLLAALGLSHILSDAEDPLQLALDGGGGGLVGWVMGSLTASLLGDLLVSVLLLALAGLGLWLAVRALGIARFDWHSLPDRLGDFWQSLLPDAPEEPEIEEEKPVRVAKSSRSRAAAAKSADDDYDRPSIAATEPVKVHRVARTKARPQPIKAQPRPDFLPPLSLLAEEPADLDTSIDVKEKIQVIETTLASFSVPVKVVEVNVGPAVTQFGVVPGTLPRRGPDGTTVDRRVRVSRIKALTDDLALALEAPTLRIEAPVPGKGFVGIEVPNRDTDVVPLRSVLESPAMTGHKSPLVIGMGRDVGGNPVASDLSVMPHLLIAGATGSGKSVCINAIVASLLFNNGPDVLRLLLVDPKRVELVAFNGVPHLISPVVTDIEQVIGALTWMTLQMDERYRNFARVGARQLKDYNRKVDRKNKPPEWADLEPYPYFVLVIDELADLMSAAPEKVEFYVCRLAQMARATGIHLVVATQRPSVDVVTGLIKANFPSRIAFSVTSQMDSRVILDTPGADKLLGRGDMLFMRPDSSKLERIQGSFISDKEIEALVRFWKTAMPAEALAPNQPRYPWTGLMAEMEDQDDLYERALDLVEKEERVSTSWLQRRLRVSYNRAAELMARMEEDGYVGYDEGAGRGREVLLVAGEDDDGDDWLE
ncbi:MAG: DNA translocase FtsK [Anaerolineales bacterium]|nr:DNA translocase FtsK [Anaerolineales bacterium]